MVRDEVDLHEANGNDDEHFDNRHPRLRRGRVSRQLVVSDVSLALLLNVLADLEKVLLCSGQQSFQLIQRVLIGLVFRVAVTARHLQIDFLCRIVFLLPAELDGRTV